MRTSTKRRLAVITAIATLFLTSCGNADSSSYPVLTSDSNGTSSSQQDNSSNSDNSKTEQNQTSSSESSNNTSTGNESQTDGTSNSENGTSSDKVSTTTSPTVTTPVQTSIQVVTLDNGKTETRVVTVTAPSQVITFTPRPGESSTPTSTSPVSGSEVDTNTNSDTSSDSNTSSQGPVSSTPTSSQKPATSTSKEEIKVSPLNKIMYSNQTANIRSSNGTQYDIVHTVKKNTSIGIIGICENGWYKVTVNDIEGYMSSTVLGDVKVTTTSTTTTAKKPETTPSTTTTKNPETTIVTTYTTDYEYKDAPYYDYDGAYHMVDYINQIRRAEGVGEVVADERLMEAARVRAKELSELFSHNRPNGTGGTTVIYEYFDGMWYRGENIAMNSRFSPYGTFMAFYNSDGHRNTMLDAGVSIVGIGYYYAEDGLLYCCQLFAGKF